MGRADHNDSVPSFNHYIWSNIAGMQFRDYIPGDLMNLCQDEVTRVVVNHIDVNVMVLFGSDSCSSGVFLEIFLGFMHVSVVTEDERLYIASKRGRIPYLAVRPSV